MGLAVRMTAAGDVGVTSRHCEVSLGFREVKGSSRLSHLKGVWQANDAGYRRSSFGRSSTAHHSCASSLLLGRNTVPSLQFRQLLMTFGRNDGSTLDLRDAARS